MVLVEGVADRLKALRSELSVTQKKFAELLSCSQGKVSDYESGKLSVSNSDLSIIANSYNVNLNWLITGEGEMFNNVRAREGLLSNLIRLPVVGDIAAGFPTEVVQDEPTEFIEVSATLLELPPPYYVFKVNGESMLPVIHPGDYVIISTDWRGIKLNSRICAFRTADGITLKQYVNDRKNKTIWLFPINSSFNPIPFNDYTETCRLIGVLVLSIRKYT